jgi:hypothetical protein
VGIHVLPLVILSGETLPPDEAFKLKVSFKDKNFTLLATYQGCNEWLGVCYPPIEKSFDLVLPWRDWSNGSHFTKLGIGDLLDHLERAPCR